MTTLTCPQIKEIYSTFMSNAIKTHHELAVVDTAAKLQELEKNMTELRNEFLRLLGNSSIGVEMDLGRYRKIMMMIFQKHSIQTLNSKTGELSEAY